MNGLIGPLIIGGDALGLNNQFVDEFLIGTLLASHKTCDMIVINVLLAKFKEATTIIFSDLSCKGDSSF